MGSQYTNDTVEKDIFIHESKKFPNQFNCFINRMNKYQTAGRNQTENEAKIIDLEIKNMLSTNNILYTDFNCCIEDYDKIITIIQKIIKENKC